MLRVGCCGWCVGRPAYFSTYNAVELQDTFYDRPDPSKLSRLRSEAPDGFAFAMKAWQAVTHPPGSPTWRRAKEKLPSDLADRYGNLRTTKENLEAWDVVAGAARALGARVVVLQTPPSFGYSPENVRQAREFLRAVVTKDFVIGWEPRGSWRDRPEAVIEVLGDLDNVVHVVDPFRSEPVRLGRVAYFRLHGIGRGEVNYRYRYTVTDLTSLCEKVLPLLSSYEVFVMFNNVFMKDDARSFTDVCGVKG